MKIAIGMAAIAAMLLLSLPDDARSAELSAAGTNRDTAVKSSALVKVEVRFVEIAEKDLYPSGMQSASGVESNSVSTRGKMDQTEGHAPSARVYPGQAGSNALALARACTNTDMSFILHALENWDGVNLLSAPSVTTESGKNAIIKVVREVRYPVEFEAQVAVLDKASGKISLLSNESTSASNQVMSAVGIPKFETRETGVILSVTPVVSPDGKTIHLTMNPQVVELVEWIDFGSTMKYADGSSQQVKMLQPVFHSRSLNSHISIWDGQTVVMGGMVTETQTNIVDKIPYLGSVPLVGKLFRSETTEHIKCNLFILVTARIVDAAGNPIGSPKGD